MSNCTDSNVLFARHLPEMRSYLQLDGFALHLVQRGLLTERDVRVHAARACLCSSRVKGHALLRPSTFTGMCAGDLPARAGRRRPAVLPSRAAA